MGNQYTQYAYTDASAPVLNKATAGSLTALYDAVLVNGYGAKAAAGWTKPFSSTNIGVYQAPGGVQHYYQVIDNTTAVQASLFGFETMSAFNTGTGQFPTNAQLSTSSIPKGGAADPQQWFMFADSRSAIFVAEGYGTGTGFAGVYFGEIFALQSGDTFRSLVKTHNSIGGSNDFLGAISAAISSTTANAFMPRGYSGVGTSVQMSVTGDNAKSGAATVLKGIVPFPNPEEGGLYLSPLWVADPTTSPANNVRGRMRGFWHCLHANTSINHLQTFTGIGDLAGKTFIAIKPQGDASSSGTFIIETSATLETN